MARVLVIDDEPDVVRLILKVLSARGHMVQTARDGARALERVRDEPPDVILLDSDVPKIDGAEVCRRIKTDATTMKIPVVMILSPPGTAFGCETLTDSNCIRRILLMSHPYECRRADQAPQALPTIFAAHSINAGWPSVDFLGSAWRSSRGFGSERGSLAAGRAPSTVGSHAVA